MSFYEEEELVVVLVVLVLVLMIMIMIIDLVKVTSHMADHVGICKRLG